VNANAVFSQHFPSFLRGTKSYDFSRSTKQTCPDFFGILSRFLKYLFGNKNLVCSAASRTKTASSIIQIWLNYISPHVFQTLVIHFPMKTKDWDDSVVSEFIPVSLFSIKRITQFVKLLVASQNTGLLETHESAKEFLFDSRIWAFWSDFIAAPSIPVFCVLKSGRNVAAVMYFSHSKSCN